MTGHHDLWRTLRSSSTPLTAAELAVAAGCARRSAEQRLNLWHGRGYVDRQANKPARWTIGVDAPASAPTFSRAGEELNRREPNTGPLWRAMRVLSRRGVFDIEALAVTASTTSAYAQNYVNKLRRAGYVRMSGNHRSAQFRLVRDTGLKPPRIEVRPGRRTLIDFNTGQRIDISPAATSLRRKSTAALADGGVG